MHEPDFDQVLRPVEFDEAISDKFFVALTVIDDTFHVTVVEVAADTELAVTPPNNPATTNTDTVTIRFMQQTLLNRIGLAGVALYTESVRFRDANGSTLASFCYWCRGVDDHWAATRRTL